MSYQAFFPDDADQHTVPDDEPPPHTTIGDVLAGASAYPAPDLAFLQGSSAAQQQQYYTLSAALAHHSAAFSDPAYIPTPKLESAALYPQHAPYARFQPYSQYPAFLHEPYDHYPHDLILLDPPRPSPSPGPVKEEPRTPTSPQFIFEFPGGEPDPDADEPFALDLDPEPEPRGASPATEEMKSMMSVFRVDPFASYDADPGSRRRRRKRASAYARTTDPAASAREPPLMFTFQLDVAGGFDDADEEPVSTAAAAAAADDDDDDEYADEPEYARAPPSSPPHPFARAYPAFARAPSPDYTTAFLLPAAFPASPASSASPPASPPRTKAHPCWLCHKAFPRPSGLATHMHTHSGAKPYRCPVPACAKPFAVRSNARRHLRTHSALALASAFNAPEFPCEVAVGAC